MKLKKIICIFTLCIFTSSLHTYAFTALLVSKNTTQEKIANEYIEVMSVGPYSSQEGVSTMYRVSFSGIEERLDMTIEKINVDTSEELEKRFMSAYTLDFGGLLQKHNVRSDVDTKSIRWVSWNTFEIKSGWQLFLIQIEEKKNSDIVLSIVQKQAGRKSK